MTASASQALPTLVDPGICAPVMSSLTDTQIRAALHALAREGPEALRSPLHPDVVWSATDQPGYDCRGRDAVLATLRHLTDDDATWQIGSVRQIELERVVVEVHVRREGGSARDRRLTISAANGLIVGTDGAPADGNAYPVAGGHRAE
jgi:SnoaL-like domain